MLSIKFFRTFLFLLFAIYYAQDWLYTGGSFISQSSIVLVIFISGVYLVKTLFLKEEKNLLFISWTLLIFLNIVGFLINLNWSNDQVTNMFKYIMGGMLPFYPFYYFAKKDGLKESHFVWFLFLMLPIIIIRYFMYSNSILSESTSDVADVVNNISYSFVAFSPFVFLIKEKKVLSGALMALIIMFVIQGAKRGAIIACLISLIMFFYFQLRNMDKHDRVRGYFFSIVMILSLTFIVYITSISNEFMLNRILSIAEGNTSNRDFLYRGLFNSWYNSSNIWNLCFGYGFGASLNLVGGYAHNDWLELLSNFGLLGIILYMFWFIGVVKYIQNPIWARDKRILLTTIILIWGFTSLVSMAYTSLDSYPYAMLFGYLAGSRNLDLAHKNVI